MQMEKKNNSMRIKVVILGVLLFAFCAIISFLWYRVFREDKIAITNLTIALKDGGKGVDIDSLFPKSDVEAQSVPAYSFDITNTGDISGQYEILLEDSVKKDEDGYQAKKFLTRDNLKYELSLNGKVIAKNLLSTIKHNRLDTRIIGANKKNSYRLRIWVPMNAKNWQDKTYHYRVVVKPVQEGEE